MMSLFLYLFAFTLLFLFRWRFRFRLRFLFLFPFLFRIPVSCFSRRPIISLAWFIRKVLQKGEIVRSSQPCQFSRKQPPSP